MVNTTVDAEGKSIPALFIVQSVLYSHLAGFICE